jgi:hypothetical protein
MFMLGCEVHNKLQFLKRKFLQFTPFTENILGFASTWYPIQNVRVFHNPAACCNKPLHPKQKDLIYEFLFRVMSGIVKL